MAKGNVKKGFATYLLILFIAIIAAFLILVTIMLFSPFKSILGFKYFVYKNSYFYENVINGPEDEHFDFSTIKKINIDCNYSNVEIERYYNTSVGRVYFENKCSGFAREDQDTDYKYSLYYTDYTKSELNIKVVEPEGLLFFKKEVNIVIRVPLEAETSFENTEIEISNTNGSVLIGNNGAISNKEENKDKNYISFKTLNIKTTNGSVTVFPYVKHFDNLFIKTTSGDVKIRREVDVKNLDVHSSNGDIYFSSIKAENATFDLGDSDFSASSINVTGIASLTLSDGYFNVDSFTGLLNSNKKAMSGAKIEIDQYSGKLSLPDISKSNVKIKNIGENSQVYLRGGDCKIDINNFKGDKLLIETTSGEVNVTSYSKFIDIITTKGNINLDYLSAALPAEGIKLQTTSGDIKMKVLQTLAYTLEVKNTSGNLRSSKNISIEGFGSSVQNPQSVNSGGNHIYVTSNGKVSIYN